MLQKAVHYTIFQGWDELDGEAGCLLGEGGGIIGDWWHTPLQH